MPGNKYIGITHTIKIVRLVQKSNALITNKRWFIYFLMVSINSDFKVY
jgi:hypothetical protein